MTAYLPTAGSIERSMGTVPFMHLLLVLAILGGAAYVFVSFAAAFGPLKLGGWLVQQCAVGLSGVIFGLIVIDSASSASTHRSVFGFFNVPVAAYPWALLLACQLLMPGASFLGHLCGVLVGQLYVWEWLTWLLLPPDAVRWLESCSLMAVLSRQSSFVAVYGPSASAGGSGPTLPILQPRPLYRSITMAGSMLQWLRLSDRSSTTAAADPNIATTGDVERKKPPAPGFRREGSTGAHPAAQQTGISTAESSRQQQQQQQQQGESTVVAPGRGRQLDPEAGGAMEALAARAAAAAAAEARAAKYSHVTAASTTSSQPDGDTPQQRHWKEARSAVRPSQAAQAAELRAHGIGCGSFAPQTPQDASRVSSEESAYGRLCTSTSGRSDGDASASRQQTPLGQISSRTLSILTDMGFTPNAASEALEAAHGNLHLAADMLSRPP